MSNPYLKPTQSEPEPVTNLRRLYQSPATPALDKSRYTSPSQPETSKPTAYESPGQSSRSEPRYTPSRPSPSPQPAGNYVRPAESLARELREKSHREAEVKAKAQQAAEKRKQLEAKARDFLAKIDALPELDGDRLWFEDYAQSCPSRLDAAIDFIVNECV